MGTGAINLILTMGRRLWNDCKAQDLIEYALMASFVAVAVAAIFPSDIAPSISTVFSKVVSVIDATPG